MHGRHVRLGRKILATVLVHRVVCVMVWFVLMGFRRCLLRVFREASVRACGCGMLWAVTCRMATIFHSAVTAGIWGCTFFKPRRFINHCINHCVNHYVQSLRQPLHSIIASTIASKRSYPRSLDSDVYMFRAFLR